VRGAARAVPAPTTAGYSATPLAKKRGIRANRRLYLQAAAADYSKLVAPLKVCAVDATWSGLKLMGREAKRPRQQ
jgi:hypothetical protein